ncbi:hypothetical protein MVEN_01718400 [Mycena venus]|uniref:Uncharacterized protein n=1 Tax=Mycena venus TaxID=2733690 RepID=A0A8H6XPT9_9AGAR|nr:hypothetical protein MVEN_01718400 [Mycena venus]
MHTLPMYPDHAEHFVPFLGQASTSSELEEAEADGYEKPLKVDTFGRGHMQRQHRRKFMSRQFLSKLMGWPGVVICGQLMLQAVAWGFFGFLQLRRGVALPSQLAAWAKANPHTVQWISTQIATILAFFFDTVIFSLHHAYAVVSHYPSLFAWGVRQSITLHLHGDGMALVTFVSFIKISTRSLILNPRRRKLSLMSIAIIILTGVQTAGWSALITPRAVVITTPLIGHEIDLSSPLFSQIHNDGLNYCVVDSTGLPAFIVEQLESGYTAVKGDLSFPAILTVMDQTFNLSTGGILPLTLSPVNASTWFQNATTIPATITPTRDLPEALDSSYSLRQQGFTADVSCEFWDSKDETIPSLFFQSNTVSGWNPEQRNPGQQYYKPGNITYWSLYSDCVMNDGFGVFLNWSDAYTEAKQPNYILTIACPYQESYKLIFDSGREGLYGFMGTTVCTVVPKITNVEVSYSNVINVTTLPGDTIANITGAPALAALTTLFNMGFFSQSTVSNSMGDRVRSLVREQDGDIFIPNTTLRATEEFIRGVTEWSASVFRACLWSNRNFSDVLPSTTNLSASGTFYSDSMGWIHASPITWLELIPGTIVAILTIYTVVMGVAHHAGDLGGEFFDPSDALHLVTASAAGGLNEVFTGPKQEGFQEAENVNVRLGTIPGRGPVLIRSTT